MMSDISVRIDQVKSSIRQASTKANRNPEDILLLGVTKTVDVDVIKEALECGITDVGENKPQELQRKYGLIGNRAKWHQIGTLQTNKVKYIAPFIGMIESVTSEKLLLEINKQALKNHRTIDVLLEVHIAREESKSGFSPEEVFELLQKVKANPEAYNGICICGLMAMATNTDDEAQIALEFDTIARLHADIKQSGLLLAPEDFTELSIGMSSDYHIALKHGATLVRVGSAIFGERD